MTILLIVTAISIVGYFLFVKSKVIKDKPADRLDDNNVAIFTVDINVEKYLATMGKSRGVMEAGSEQVAGVIGNEVYSENNNYCVVSSYGNSSNNGVVSLVRVSDQERLFKKSVPRPHDCHVSNNGIVVCCDWIGFDLSVQEGAFWVIDNTGKVLVSKNVSANVGNCAVSNDGKIGLFETFNSKTDDSDRIFLIDIETGHELLKFPRPYSFVEAIIDSQTKRIRLIDNRKFVYEIDFNGTCVNEVEYEEQVISRGSVYDKLTYYYNKPSKMKFADNRYITILKQSLTDKDASYSFGQDKLYRLIGEYYEANGDMVQAVKNWEMAVKINPKVGIKRKLDLLRKSL